MLRLLATGNSHELLSRLNLHNMPGPEEMHHLSNMATALLELRGKHNKQICQSDDLRPAAIAHSLNVLAGHHAESKHTMWAYNAFRNGLRTTATGSAFMAIDARLCKLGVWLSRNQFTPWHQKIFPMRNKNPFRALRLGMMGANLGDWKNGQSPKQTNIQKRAAPSQIFVHLSHLIEQIQGASRYRFLSGGVAGLSTKGVSGTLTGLFLGLLARFKLDLRWMKLRQAGVEIAMPPYNLEMSIFSSQGNQTQIGAGAAIGPGMGPFEITAGGSIKALSIDQREDSGVVLRMPRERGKEQQLRLQFKAMLSDLLTLAPGAKGNGTLLKTLLERYPNLSVNIIGSAGEYKRTHGANLEVNAGISAGLAKVAVHGEAGVQFHARMSRHHRDCGGAIQVHRHLLGRRLQIGAEGRLEARFAGISDPFRANMLTLDGLTGSVDFATAGRHVKRDVVYVEGKISPLSYYEVEYQSFEDFKHAIMQRLDVWSNAKAKQGNKTIEAAEAEILAFLKKVAERRKPHHTFAARCELREAVAREIDALHGLIAQHENHPSLQRQALAEHLRRALLEKLECRDSYEETSFRAYDRNDRTETGGIHAALRLEHVNQAEGVHAHTRLM
ncbi:MAG TPA: hypothetical protein VFV39_02905 [Limnobacter sp.]|nr:hypothetical protein [Limnobacter sp.]